MTRRQLTGDQEALARVRELVRDVGCDPVYHSPTTAPTMVARAPRAGADHAALSRVEGVHGG